MKKLTVIFIWALALSYTTKAHENIYQNLINQKNYFIENKGQWHEDVLYLARLKNLDLWITKYGLNYTFYVLNENQCKSDKYIDELKKDDFIQIHRVLAKYKNANPAPVGEGKNRLSYYHNYFLGNDATKHVKNVGLYQEVVIKDVYEGIDIRYYFENNKVRYDYIVNPGADPGQIEWTIEGADNVVIDQNKLIFTIRFGEVEHIDLHVYQNINGKKKNVQSKWINTGNTFKFYLDNYDNNYPLIIDPLIYSTYIGGTNSDQAKGVYLSDNGLAFVTGNTYSINYDIIWGYQLTNAGNNDAFITIVNQNGTGLMYSTYFGGSGFDFGTDIVAQGQNIYITGSTKSTNFPIVGSSQAFNNGGSDNSQADAFIVKLDYINNNLIFSKYWGGYGDESGNAIGLDNSGNIYIAGYCVNLSANNIPMPTNGAFSGATQSTDGFILRFSSSGVIISGTFLGQGSSSQQIEDIIYDLSLDNTGNVYVCGRTNGAFTPTLATWGAIQSTYMGGSNDGFVAKFNSSLSNLLNYTFLGGAGDDRAFGISVDPSGLVYVTGHTQSNNFYLNNAIQSTLSGTQDAFVCKLNNSFTSSVYSTYLGGTSVEVGNGIAADPSGNALITGYTASANFSVTYYAVQSVKDFAQDVFFTKLNSTGNNIVYSTFLGGSAGDFANAISYNSNLDQIVITGQTFSSNFDITTGVYQSVNDGSGDNFVVKFCNPPLANPSSNSPVCEGQTINLYGNTVSGSTYSWSGPSGYSSTTQNSSINSATSANAGLYEYTVTNANGCTNKDTVSVIVIPLPVVTPSSNSPVCEGQTLNLTANSISGATYSWSGPGGFSSNSQNPSINNVPVSASGTYTLTITDANGCSDSATTNVVVNPLPVVTPSSNSPVCVGQTLNLTANSVSGATYSWSGPGGFTSSSQNPSISNVPVSASGTYTLVITDANGCTDSATTNVVVNPLPVVTPSSNSPVCEGQTLNLTANSISGATYSWSGPGGFSSNSQNPSINNVPVSASGTYTLTITDANGCSDSATTNVVVNPLPVVTPSSNSPVCEGQTLNLTANSISGATYSWSGPGGFSSNSQNPSINNVPVTASGNYTLTITDLNGCSNSSSISVTINPLPSFTISANDSNLCVGDTLQLFASNNTLTYSWSGPNSFSSNLQNPVINNITTSANGMYYVVATDANGCSNADSININVATNPTISLTSNSPVCEREQLTINLTTDNGISFSWNGPNSFSSSQKDVSINNIALSDSGMYYVSVTNNNGCSSLDSIFITVNPTPVAVAMGDTVINQISTATLYASGGTSYVWAPTNGLSCANCSMAFAKPGETTDYCVTVSNSYGCSDTACVRVVVEIVCGEVFVPNVFSPNGDGVNDVIQVMNPCLETIDWEIYNRWGEKVFSTDDPSDAWDGSYKGKVLNGEVYHYRLTAKLTNGETVQQKGTITIVK